MGPDATLPQGLLTVLSLQSAHFELRKRFLPGWSGNQETLASEYSGFSPVHWGCVFFSIPLRTCVRKGFP